MLLKKPASMEECIYFTNRTIDLGINSGRVMAWVFRKECGQCKKGSMSKPQKKNGKIDKKADHYICNSCGYKESNEDVENSLALNVEYKCPHCGSEGETTSKYERKTFEGVPSYVFECQQCNKKIGLGKKMKERKRKGNEEFDGD